MIDNPRRRRKPILGALALLVLLAAPFDVRAEPEPRVHLLSFDRWGDLLTPLERDLAARELAASPEVERIILLAYGWNNDRETAYESYLELLDGYERAAGRKIDWSRTTVLAIGWDASLTGFRKLANDLIPLPVVADGLALVPDLALRPISYWSKAAMADRIGYGGLRGALNRIVGPENLGRPAPPIYLLAHSFGARIVSALMKQRLGIAAVGEEPFAARDRVRGALLVQPAAIEINLHERADYPVLVVQSRHDHANGFLFPIANVPWNAFSFTMFEAVVEHRLLPLVTSTARALPRAVLGKRSVPSDPVALPRSRPRRIGLWLRRAAIEALHLPLGVAWSLASVPANYAFAQVVGLVRHPLDHVMDSLAQLPLVEIPVWGLSEALGREVNWGDRGKGIFSLGPVNESAARISTPIIGRNQTLPVYDLRREILGDPWASQPCGLPACRGITLIDASEDIRRGALWDEDLGSPAIDFTLGWLDPIGAHNDYLQPPVYRLIDRLIHAGE